MATPPVLVPDFAVTINGVDLETKDETKVFEVVFNDRVDAADFFSIQLGLVDGAVARPDWIDDPLFREGGKAQIKLGYAGDALKTMIDGEITAVHPHFTSRGPTTLVLQGFDRLHRLRRGRKSRTFLNMSDREIAQKIADENGLQLQCADPPNIKHEHVYQHNQSDLDFLVRLATRIGYEVKVEEKTLHFRRSKESRAKVTTLQWSEPGDTELSSLVLRLSTADQVSEVTVQGWNPKEKRQIVGRARTGDESTRMAGSHTAGEVATAAFGRAQRVVVDHPIATVEEAEALARAKFNELSLGFIVGEGLSLGNPDIRAGAVIELKGLGQLLSGLYYVVASNHTCGRDTHGYITEFTVTRNASTGGPADGATTAGASAAPSGGAGSAAARSGVGAGGAAAAADGTATKKTDWIEIKLVDQEGKPVPGEKYRVELPDGSTRQGVLNSQGVAWEGNLDPGTCKITFPDLDGTEWRRA